MPLFTAECQVKLWAKVTKPYVISVPRKLNLLEVCITVYSNRQHKVTVIICMYPLLIKGVPYSLFRRIFSINMHEIVIKMEFLSSKNFYEIRLILFTS